MLFYMGVKLGLLPEREWHKLDFKQGSERVWTQESGSNKKLEVIKSKTAWLVGK